jgi:hypothetical protein
MFDLLRESVGLGIVGSFGATVAIFLYRLATGGA